jgi:hypothetical protein
VISEQEAMLVLRGWSERRLRVIVQAPGVSFSGFCTLWNIEDGFIRLWIENEADNNLVALWLGGCVFDFTDVRPEQAEIPVRASVESGIAGTRKDFSITVMLLK